MKNVILAITMLFFGGSFTDMEESNDLNLQGVWQEYVGTEFVRIGSRDLVMSFQRVDNKKLVSHGTFTTEDGKMFINNEYSNEEYELEYVFSPSGGTLVVSKPNSDEAWVFFKAGY